VAVVENLSSLVRPLRRGWRFAASVISVRDRYVLRHYIYAYIVCAVSFLGLYMAVELLSRLSKFLASHGIPFWQVIIEYYSVMFPVVYTYYLGPALTLAAAMFSLTMLNKNNEIMPLKAAGVSLYRIVAPIFILGFFFAVLTFLSQEIFMPLLRDRIREVYGYSHSGTSLESLVVVDSKGYEFTVGRYWPMLKRGENIIVTKRAYSPSAGKMVNKERFTAPYMQWEIKRDFGDENNDGGNAAKGQWVLRPGDGEQVYEDTLDEEGNRTVREGETDSFVEYGRKIIETDLTPEDFEIGSENSTYLSARELKRRWKRSQSSNNLLLVKIHQHFTFPLTHVVLLLIGLPFVLNQNNRSVALGVIVSLAICAAYYLVNAMCSTLGARGVLQPVVAAWLPVLFFTGLGVVLFDNLRT
jgi:lipopolysaccharide export LptBFGC system permease protein LptF